MQRFLVGCALLAALCAVAVAEKWPSSNPDVEGQWPPGQSIAAETERHGKHRHAGHGRYEYVPDTKYNDRYEEEKEPKYEPEEPKDKYEEHEEYKGYPGGKWCVARSQEQLHAALVARTLVVGQQNWPIQNQSNPLICAQPALTPCKVLL